MRLREPRLSRPFKTIILIQLSAPATAADDNQPKDAARNRNVNEWRERKHDVVEYKDGHGHDWENW